MLWALSDLLITGNPLHSLTGTRDTAADLGRVTGLQHVPTTLPRRLGEILREPVLLGAAIGGVLSLWRLRERRGVLLGAAAGVLAIVAFCVLATAGLSILTRYLLLPATLLAIFAAAGVFGWLELPREDPWRARWIAGAALTAVAMLAFVPSQVDRIRNTRAALVAQTKILDELHDLAPRGALRDRHRAQPPRRPAARAVDRPPPRRHPQRPGDRPLRGLRVRPGLAGGRAASSSSTRATRTRRCRPRRRCAPSVRGAYWHLYDDCP